MTRPVKRSFSIKGHRTSISLEAQFWDALRDAAAEQKMPLAGLIAKIDETRGSGGLSGAVRIWILDYYRRRGLPQQLRRRQPRRRPHATRHGRAQCQGTNVSIWPWMAVSEGGHDGAVISADQKMLLEAPNEKGIAHPERMAIPAVMSRDDCCRVPRQGVGALAGALALGVSLTLTEMPPYP